MKSVKKTLFATIFLAAINNAMAACPPGTLMASTDDVSANINAACDRLGTWDIARTSDRGSISGRGYGCPVYKKDLRPLGNVICKKIISFETTIAPSCPVGTTLVDSSTAIHYAKRICEILPEWSIVRIANNGSMDGAGYRCGIRIQDNRLLGDTLCARYEFIEGDGTW